MNDLTRKRSALESALVDGAVLAGLGFVSYGAWLAYAPAGFMVGGGLVLVLGVLGARR